MKNKRRIFIVCIYLCIGIAVFFIKQNSSLGNLSENITIEKSSNSEITFSGNKGDELKCKYKSSVKEGTLNLSLTDSEGNVVESFQINEGSMKPVSLDKDGEYILSATYNDFIGSYEIAVSK